ncbi:MULTISPECIES: phycobilisome linker polypeptide [unclassified Tolypothrix]|uniref:phycobilisome linker polypeptide n=1 Tax=unclassified Tolypothrix TaxID=2649714 RepID=UPI0005EAA49B|nr:MULTISPECIES: phycobilisome linker polypeptide [unclassified Tolypothrix]BAY93812.1 phycobilisome linker polypeptide CpcC2 [Microchaete diplosiphon NIES-3275]EKF03347.1 phycobilisome rod-core linker protein [Tolypothrix sp. PCC 7601]MBE9081935.1 phycobilisome linker polypeptide [Tolypothrix sp. LEGE 11397]UYD27603.1 phycobilisome linker polypeptide [Tolypothrix sp. PCC 7712]UYD36535.1 phycobilisome linker polypeptide [Tolypothrix sp. PCC 7601]
MAPLTEASRLGVRPFADSDKVELRFVKTAEEVRSVIWSAYRQVLGNEHLFESERLSSAESLLQQAQISVRDFVRAIAQSELYRQKFFYSNSQVRFIELNYKHLLGRAPYDESEIAYHVDIYTSQGYEAEINSYIDSVEYQQNFGDSIVPYYRGYQTTVGQKTAGFPRFFQLYRGYANSDRAQNKSKGQLTWDLAKNLVSPIYPADAGSLTGVSTGNRGGNTYRIRTTQAASPNSPRIRQSISEVVVPFDQLSNLLQQLNRQGRKVISIALS